MRAYRPTGPRPGGCGPWLRRGCLALLAALVVVVLGGAAATGLVYAALSRELEDGLGRLTAYDQSQSFQTTRIFDRNGVLLYEIFGEGKRTRVPLTAIPADLINATVATEDRTFWDNPGVDLPAIAGAFWRNTQAGEIQSGASTITQQLVRHVAFSYEERTEQSMRRKLKEALLAIVLTRMKSKDEILELYLNEIYYGNLAYGVEAAAQTYFGRPAVELTRAEATMLAGLPQSPAQLDPYNPNPLARAAVRERHATVLELMVRRGYLSPAEAEATRDEELHWVPLRASVVAPHFVFYVRQLLEELHGPDVVAHGGLRVTTSLDVRYQALAEEIARAHVGRLRDAHNLTNAALVAIKPGTGEILAMLGSVDYYDDAIDGRVNVALAERQPGSAIKPLTYAAAFEQGFSPADVLWDVETRFPQYDGSAYIPVNYDGRFHGPVRVRDALANSYNIPAVQLLRYVGVERLIDFSHRLGITGLRRGTSVYGLALTLGGGEVRLLDLTAAFGAFANGGAIAGRPVPEQRRLEGNPALEPLAILRVEDSAGRLLWTAPQVAPEAVLDPRIAYQITSILSDNIARSPAFGADSPLKLDRPAAVKTGTSNDFRDNWTIGYTPGLVVGVWAGNSDNSPMVDVSGIRGAAPIWHDFVTGIYAVPALQAELAIDGQLPPDDFVRPPGLVDQPVCVLASLHDPASECPAQRTELLLASPPLRPADLADGLSAPTDTPGPTTAANRVRIDPGLYRLRVLPVPAELGQQLLAALAGGEPLPTTLAPLRYCAVPETLGEPAGSSELLFIAAPADARTALQAALWAQEHATPLEPPSCQREVVVQTTGGGGLQAVWLIREPGPAAVIGQSVPIIGTAQFSKDSVAYYKVEIGPGRAPSEWWFVASGTEPVSDGLLATLPGDLLPPGDYVLRLVLVKTDGNFPAPYEVPISIARP
jgi:penicillin-binding protein 1C